MTDKKKLSREIYPDIFKISLPFPGKQPGPINVYLFLGKKITLLDTGIIGDVKYLRNALAGIGRDFSDIDQIVISHGHVDHYGAAHRIVKQSGGRASVAAHADDVRLIETGDDVPEKISKKFLRMMGVPFLYIYMMDILRHAFRFMVDNCVVDVVLKDGDDIVMGDYRGTVISTPGHSKGAICVYLKDENILFAGDHILEHITPNALVMLEPASVLPRRLSQSEYYKSLAKIESLGSPMIYTGHGRDIDNLAKTTALYRSQYSERRSLILSTVSEGEYDVYHIARRVFPDLSGFNVFLQIYLAVSEVYTHLQVLEREKMLKTEIVKKRVVARKI